MPSVDSAGLWTFLVDTCDGRVWRLEVDDEIGRHWCSIPFLPPMMAQRSGREWQWS